MDVILLAAGVGKRAKLDFPKQFYKINGKPFLVYSMERLLSCSAVTRILVTCQSEYMDEYKRYVDEYDIQNIEYVIGGATRHESVFNALQQVNTAKVMIHEAARPLISKEFVQEIVDASTNEDAVVPTIPIKFTVSKGGDYMTGELNRNELHNIQLPQVFTSSLLKEFHEKAKKDQLQATEDGSLFFHYGGKVRFVEGRESNIKITTPLDVELVNKLLTF
ncbi:2-C-methyl-D-erythritol 4-phosphate cytidylyltransferase [Carboxylicivirga sp. M1479]|uniref:2-C-methyl-D-erythritol 4-phosphate cytidylyltransferase n=1 Tax=Carboxylicivirga sp. M1479 TaxID=2594476 RepID=UPI001178934F|nr:2-C-methyl-D-erythritol 4-phosphate cytidylyltransferase [Carboxylicivirga sp. M1479]TRX66237.1 2-C-methyl-D-erythritol 4-phosphate cytidylyltransferase [Carboxylicivirga sp. M1479]